MTKIIGLTGGIGSGKTTISKMFESMGVPVYIADEAGKKLTDTEPVLQQIREQFGPSVIANGKLDRAEMAKIVFDDPSQLQKLNAIVHPAVHEHFTNWMCQQNNVPWVIRESAILFESGSYKDCDKIICVTAPLEMRIDRVIQRDGITREQVLQRIGNQMADEERIERSDYVIDNTKRSTAEKQAKEILKNLQIDKKGI